MTGMFKVSDPGTARGNQVTAREILDKASSQIDSGLAQDPELQTQMMMAMGLVYENLGIYDRAESLYEGRSMSDSSISALRTTTPSSRRPRWAGFSIAGPLSRLPRASSAGASIAECAAMGKER